MDTKELFRSCRTGDLVKLKHLVEVKEVEVNVRDIWDCTPLYYACLCGHYEIVKYLLYVGAKCEANTYDGERCRYSALTPEIRQLLQHSNAVTSSDMRHDCYEDFLRKMYESGHHSDITLQMNGKRLKLHRCVLAARCKIFHKIFTAWPDKDIINLAADTCNTDAFNAFLQYIYTGSLKVSVNHATDLIMLADNCHLHKLVDEVHSFYKMNQLHISAKGEATVNIMVIEAKKDCKEVKKSFTGLPLILNAEHRGVRATELAHHDVVFEIGNVVFYCHKVFFCLRSEYFKTLIHTPLTHNQSKDDAGRTVIRLHYFTPAVFQYIVFHVYAEDVQLEEGIVGEVLMAAEMCLLPGLKRQCGSFIAQNLEPHNVCGVLTTARMLRMPRLEGQCYKYIAEHLEEVAEMESFRKIIAEDAAAVHLREDCDSIEIIDNVRYHLMADSLVEATKKSAIIDRLLTELNLSA